MQSASVGTVFTKQETFGQFPLQVNGFQDIHESLEATTMQDEIEAVNKDATTQKSGQEVAFFFLLIYIQSFRNILLCHKFLAQVLCYSDVDT